MKHRLTATILVMLSFTSPQSAEGDDAAVRKTLDDFVEVFNQKETDRIASFWTEKAIHTDRETGERTEGRDAIQADFAKVFSDQPGIKLTVRVDRVKLITPDVASVEGQTTVVLSDSDPVISSFTALLVHQTDRWLIESIDEMALPVPATSADALRELEWLVGDWVDESEGTKVQTTFRWSASVRRQLEVRFSDN